MREIDTIMQMIEASQSIERTRDLIRFLRSQIDLGHQPSWDKFPKATSIYFKETSVTK